MRDGDYSGAISSACGAIDAVTAEIYTQKGWGKPGKASFQERVVNCLNELNVYTKLVHELKDLGWEPSNSKPLTLTTKPHKSPAFLPSAARPLNYSILRVSVVNL